MIQIMKHTSQESLVLWSLKPIRHSTCLLPPRHGPPSRAGFAALLLLTQGIEIEVRSGGTWPAAGRRSCTRVYSRMSCRVQSPS